MIKRIVHLKWAINIKYLKYITLLLPLSQKCHIFKSCIDVIFQESWKKGVISNPSLLIKKF